jgi:phosphoribosylformylglycinamidine synthase
LNEAAEEELIISAHDSSDGGLAVALAEIAITGNIGIEIDIDARVFESVSRMDAKLFGEVPGRVVVGVKDEEMAVKMEAKARNRGLNVCRLGRTQRDLNLVIGSIINVPVSELRDYYETALPRLMS